MKYLLGLRAINRHFWNMFGYETSLEALETPNLEAPEVALVLQAGETWMYISQETSITFLSSKDVENQWVQLCRRFPDLVSRDESCSPGV